MRAARQAAGSASGGVGGGGTGSSTAPSSTATNSLAGTISPQSLLTAPIPRSLDVDTFERWCDAELSGSVVIGRRALKGIRTSVWEDEPLIYRALLLLRDFYVPMRINSGDAARREFEAALQALQLDLSHTGEMVRTMSDLYSVQYERYKYPLDQHLKKGNSHDPRHCFRLYFHWHAEDRMVLVGWLPSHLQNRAT